MVNTKTRREGAFAYLADPSDWSSASINGLLFEYEQTVISALVPDIRYENELFKLL
jgi:hypothetical protein